jgi:Winged helix-turn helix
VAIVIERLTGVHDYPGHVWKLLRHRLHYRLLRPARRAVERNERAIARWVAEDALESGATLAAGPRSWSGTKVAPPCCR